MQPATSSVVATSKPRPSPYTKASAGATFADLVKITVFATKLEYRAKIGEVRARYISQPPPASTFVVVASLADPDFLIEIEGIAVIDRA